MSYYITELYYNADNTIFDKYGYRLVSINEDKIYSNKYTIRYSLEDKSKIGIDCYGDVPASDCWLEFNLWIYDELNIDAIVGKDIISAAIYLMKKYPAKYSNILMFLPISFYAQPHLLDEVIDALPDDFDNKEVKQIIDDKLYQWKQFTLDMMPKEVKNCTARSIEKSNK